MKNKFSLFVLVISALLTVFIVFKLDDHQTSKYNLSRFGLRHENTFVFDIDKDNKAQHLRIIKELEQIALKNNVKIVITHNDYASNIKYQYFSSNTFNDLKERFGLNKQDLPFITYGPKANIKDILNNAKYEFDLIDNLLKQDLKFYWSGSIQVLEANDYDYTNFRNDLAHYLNTTSDKLNSLYRHSGLDSLRYLIINTVIIILCLYYVLGIIQNINNNTKIIGVYLLQGYSSYKIIQKIASLDFKVILFSYCLSIVSYFFLANLPYYYFLLVLLKDLIVIGILIFIYSLILHKTLNSNFSTILKNERKLKGINKFNLSLKLLTCVFIMLNTLVISGLIKETIKIKQDTKTYYYFKDYGLIPTFDGDYLIRQNFSKTSNMLKTVATNEVLKDKYLYVNFHYYRSLALGLPMREGYKFDDLYAFISPNFLKKENINIYDKNHQKVELEEICEREIFIFPKQYNKDPQKVLDAYYDEEKDHKVKTKDKPSIYYYDNQKVRAYNLEFEYVDSPVFKIIRFDEERNAINHPNGVSLYGLSFYTALKFDTKDDKEAVINELIKYFKSVGLEKEFDGGSSFVVIGERYNETLSRIKLFTSFILGIFIILVTLYLCVLTQFVYLYHAQHHQEITVRKFLGHSYFRIYKNLYLSNIVILITSIVLTLIIKIFIKQGSLEFFMPLALLLLVLNLIIISFFTYRKYKLNSIAQLKGGL